MDYTKEILEKVEKKIESAEGKIIHAGEHIVSGVGDLLAPKKVPRHNHLLYSIYFLGFLFGLHSAITVYIDSSFLGQFTSPFGVDMIYIFAAFASMVGFLASYPIVRKVGNYRLSKWLIIVELATLTGLVSFSNVYLIALLYVIHYTVINTLIFSMDIFLEVSTPSKSAGRVRGAYLSLINLAWLISPAISSAIIKDNSYWKIYVVSAMIILPISYLVWRNFEKFKDPVYPKMSILHAIEKFTANRDFRWLAVANVILNLFYAWMIIYVPVYLTKTLGFSWTDTGLILTFMLLPFILVEYPVGKIADSGMGEKGLMMIGAIIMALSTGLLALLDVPVLWLWAMLLFMTRVGAATLETMIETYFFKKIHTRDTNILSVFRLTRSLAYFIGPVVFMIMSRYVDMRTSFVVLGAICLLIVPAVSMIKEAK